MPGPCAQAVGNEGREEAIKVEEEEQSAISQSVLSLEEEGSYIHNAADQEHNQKYPSSISPERAAFIPQRCYQLN